MLDRNITYPKAKSTFALVAQDGLWMSTHGQRLIPIDVLWMYSMVQKNPNNLKATYQLCGNFVRLFGPNFWGLGTKRKVGIKKKE
jgi:hypothetical protein